MILFQLLPNPFLSLTAAAKSADTAELFAISSIAPRAFTRI